MIKRKFTPTQTLNAAITNLGWDKQRVGLISTLDARTGAVSPRYLDVYGSGDPMLMPDNFHPTVPMWESIVTFNGKRSKLFVTTGDEHWKGRKGDLSSQFPPNPQAENLLRQPTTKTDMDLSKPLNVYGDALILTDIRDRYHSPVYKGDLADCEDLERGLISSCNIVWWEYQERLRVFFYDQPDDDDIVLLTMKFR